LDFEENLMNTTAQLALIVWILLGWRMGSVSAQDIGTRFKVVGGSSVIVITDPTVGRLLTKHDRIFIGLGTHRDFLRQQQASPVQAIVIDAERFGGEEAELDRTIERLGRLIREAESEKNEK
jgi:hypothetical protein